MNGGKAILIGLVLLVLLLLQLTVWGGGHGLAVLLKGGIPLLLIVVGAVFVYIGVSDLKGQQAQASGGPA